MADGFINGLAAVIQDAMELSSSDAYLLGLVYKPKLGGSSKKKNKQAGERISKQSMVDDQNTMIEMIETSGFKEGEEQLLCQRLRAAFDRTDLDASGNLDKRELSAALLAASGIIATSESLTNLMNAMDKDGNGVIDFEEFVAFAKNPKNMQSTKKPLTLIIIGRVKAGVNMKIRQTRKAARKVWWRWPCQGGIGDCSIERRIESGRDFFGRD